jgi:hypothetical protein
VVDVHAVFLLLGSDLVLADRNSDASCGHKPAGTARRGDAHLVAGVHVHTPPVAVVEAAIFNMIRRRSSDGHTAGWSVRAQAGSGHFGRVLRGKLACCGTAKGRTERGRAALTHSRPW